MPVLLRPVQEFQKELQTSEDKVDKVDPSSSGSLDPKIKPTGEDATVRNKE